MKGNEGFSLNDDIYFQITDSGQELLKKKNKQIRNFYPTLYRNIFSFPIHCELNGITWYKGQLHDVIHSFSEDIRFGRTIPITNIRFEEPYEDDNI